MKPTIVMTMLVPGCASARRSEVPSSEVACRGITPCRLSMRCVIVCGPAIRVNSPVATMRTDGIAKNEL